MGRHTTKLGKQSRAQTRPPLPYPVNDGRLPPDIQEAADRRAKRRKSRLAAFSAASMLAVGGAAGVSIATADEPEAGSDSEIVFSGDCGTLGVVSASSSPDSSELTVPQGSQVSYRNELGTPAELHVGDEVYDIESGSTQVFEMNRSAEVAMVPECHGLFAEYEAAQVKVSAAQSDGDESTESDTDTDTGSLPDPDDDTDAEGAQDESEAGGAGDARQGPDDGPQDEAAEPTPAEEDAEEVNAFGAPPGAEDDAAAADEMTPASDEVVAVDPKAVADGASGLLALIAITCLVGVSAAVTRTLLKQRATA